MRYDHCCGISKYVLYFVCVLDDVLSTYFFDVPHLIPDRVVTTYFKVIFCSHTHVFIFSGGNSVLSIDFTHHLFEEQFVLYRHEVWKTFMISSAT